MEEEIVNSQINNELNEQKQREDFPLLYCLKHVLDFYFGDISFDTILNISAISTEGFTSEIAIDVANEVGLKAVEKTIEASEIPNHFFPCIVLNKDDKPYVLLKKDRDIYLYDPLTNQQIKEDKSFLKHFKKAILIFRDPKRENT